MIYRRQQTIDAIYGKYCACQKIVLENKNVANSPFGQDGSLDFLDEANSCFNKSKDLLDSRSLRENDASLRNLLDFVFESSSDEDDVDYD